MFTIIQQVNRKLQLHNIFLPPMGKILGSVTRGPHIPWCATSEIRQKKDLNELNDELLQRRPLVKGLAERLFFFFFIFLRHKSSLKLRNNEESLGKIKSHYNFTTFVNL